MGKNARLLVYKKHPGKSIHIFPGHYIYLVFFCHKLMFFRCFEDSNRHYLDKIVPPPTTKSS